MNDDRTPIDFPGISRQVFERLLGEHNPKESTREELRWGDNGHIRLSLSEGTWQDFYSKEGGGLVRFVETHLSTDTKGAMEWLTTEGFVEPLSNSSAARRRIAAKKNSAIKSDKKAKDTQHTSLNTPSKQDTPASDPYRQSTLYRAYNSSEVVPEDGCHPVRLWAAKHNAWRSDLDFPKGARWLPARSDFYRGLHLGAGSITILCAPLPAWQMSYPSPPKIQAVQLIGLSDDGEPALDRSEDFLNKRGETSPGRLKRNHGQSRNAVFCIGDPRPDHTEGVAVCEGLKDALSLASRLPLTAIAFMGAPPLETAKDLALYDRVEIYPDVDKAGRTWAYQLASLVSAYGTNTTVREVIEGGDPGEAGTKLVKGTPDTADDTRAKLIGSGLQEHDAARLGEVAAQNEAIASTEEDSPDGILHAERKSTQPHPGLAAVTAIRSILSNNNGEITHTDGSGILSLLSNAKILARQNENLLLRLADRLEDALLTGQSPPDDLIEQLEVALRESQVARLSEARPAQTDWTIEGFMPQGSLCALWQERHIQDELEAAINILMARVSTLHDDERCALIPYLHKTNWLSSYLGQVDISKLLYAHPSYAIGLSGDDGYGYTGMSAKFRALLMDMKLSKVRMLWLPATALPISESSCRGFLSDLRSWCDDADATVLVSYFEGPGDTSEYQFTYSATRIEAVGGGAIQYEAHKQSAPLTKQKIILLNDGTDELTS